MNIKDNILFISKKYQKQFPNWRYGQTVFNTAFELFPKEVNKLRSTNVDPFYNDKLVDDFLRELEKLVNKNLD